MTEFNPRPVLQPLMKSHRETPGKVSDARLATGALGSWLVPRFLPDVVEEDTFKQAAYLKLLLAQNFDVSGTPSALCFYYISPLFHSSDSDVQYKLTMEVALTQEAHSPAFPRCLCKRTPCAPAT